MGYIIVSDKVNGNIDAVVNVKIVILSNIRNVPLLNIWHLKNYALRRHLSNVDVVLLATSWLLVCVCFLASIKDISILISGILFFD